MKRLGIVSGLCVAVAASCANDGSDSSVPTCKAEQDCAGADSDAGGAAATSAGGQPSAAGSTSTGGAGSGAGGVALADSGQPGGGSSAIGGATDGGAGGSIPEPPNPLCAERAWQAALPVAGAEHADDFTLGGGVALAGDGSAFAIWFAGDYDHVFANASHYTPGNGWEPQLRVDQWWFTSAPESGSLDQPPTLAASENGDAMLVWHPTTTPDGSALATSLMSMRYASGWQTPVAITDTDSYVAGVTVRADADGDFVAAWLGYTGSDRFVSMRRYARGAGWEPIEKVLLPLAVNSRGSSDPDVSMTSDGGALVVWQQVRDSGIYNGGTGTSDTEEEWIVAERFDPSTGWSGPEVLENVVPPWQLVAPRGVVAGDGSAAVTWALGQSGVLHPMVRTFSGSWSSAVNLDGTAEPGMRTPKPAIATDSHGTFMVAWGAPNGAYASQRAPAGSWSARTLLSAPRQPADIAVGDDHLAPAIAMNENGDAVVSWIESIKDSTPSLQVATYSRTSDWTPPTDLDKAFGIASAVPTLDTCGNATLVWGVESATLVWGTKAAHRTQGGSWSSPLQIGPSPALGIGVGPNGQIIASWEGDDPSLWASILTLPEHNLCGKACDAPPDATCESPTLLKLTYDKEGVCAAGQCSYAMHEIPCACQDGGCVTAPACTDLYTLTTYTASDSCTPSDCSYTRKDTMCPFRCKNGACQTDQCLGVTCNTPPADDCADASTKRQYMPTGNCNFGTCNYGWYSIACPINTHCTGQGVCAPP